MIIFYYPDRVPLFEMSTHSTGKSLSEEQLRELVLTAVRDSMQAAKREASDWTTIIDEKHNGSYFPNFQGIRNIVPKPEHTPSVEFKTFFEPDLNAAGNTTNGFKRMSRDEIELWWEFCCKCESNMSKNQACSTACPHKLPEGSGNIAIKAIVLALHNYFGKIKDAG